MANKKVEQHIYTTNYQKKESKLYFLDKDGDLSETVMCGLIGREKNGDPIYRKPDKVVKIGIEREKGYLYFIKEGKNKNCEVWRTLILKKVKKNTKEND